MFSKSMAKGIMRWKGGIRNIRNRIIKSCKSSPKRIVGNFKESLSQNNLSRLVGWNVGGMGTIHPFAGSLRIHAQVF